MSEEEILQVVPSNIVSYQLCGDRDLRRGCLFTSPLFKLDGFRGCNEYYIVAMSLKLYTPVVSWGNEFNMRMSNEDARLTVQHMVGCGVEVESNTEKDHRIRELKERIKSLEDKIYFFETIVAKSAGAELKPERLRHIREE